MTEEAALLCGRSHTTNPELIAVSSMMRNPFRKGWLVRRHAHRKKPNFWNRACKIGISYPLETVSEREQAIH